MNLEPDPRKHIVIVDDEPVNLELAENVLRDHYRLTKLISGNQLLKFLTRVQPDMILLDIQMPELNGYEVMEKINQNSNLSKIPVIFLTGQNGVESEKEGFRLGAKDFIRKPFDNQIMLARIQSQMELYSYRNRLEYLVEEKTNTIADLQHMLTISWAEVIESRDGTTGSHVRNTTTYYRVFMETLKNHPIYGLELTGDILPELLRASTLHDIGKIGISDKVLKKPGQLDKEEFEHMKRHSKIGADMIEKIITGTYVDSFLHYARDMALYHHERWDGTGYPCGLKREEIPVYVRVLSIVDVYDALTSIRPYKKAFSHENALQIMTEDCGRFFDPDIFALFLLHENLIKNTPKASPSQEA